MGTFQSVGMSANRCKSLPAYSEKAQGRLDMIRKPMCYDWSLENMPLLSIDQREGREGKSRIQTHKVRPEAVAKTLHLRPERTRYTLCIEVQRTSLANVHT